jgi:hypothetical protein
MCINFRSTTYTESSSDLVPSVVFNLETGEVEDAPVPLPGVAEEDEQDDE